MSQESIYSDEEIELLATKVASSIVASFGNCEEYAFAKVFAKAFFGKGPLEIWRQKSSSYNPKGSFPIEEEALSPAQKKIVYGMMTETVTKAEEIYKKRFKRERDEEIERLVQGAQRPTRTVEGMSKDELERIKSQKLGMIKGY